MIDLKLHRSNKIISTSLLFLYIIPDTLQLVSHTQHLLDVPSNVISYLIQFLPHLVVKVLTGIIPIVSEVLSFLLLPTALLLFVLSTQLSLLLLGCLGILPDFLS